MRRAVSSVTVALALFGAAVAPAAAAGAAPVSAVPAGVAPPVTGAGTLAVGAGPLAAAGKKKCTITDERLREVSGLVATKTGYIVINDGTLEESRKRVFFLDTKCKIAKEPVKYSGDGPFDTEDLALSPDGKTLWIADTGDNVTSRERRTRVAVWTMPVSGSKQPVLHRLSYPERKPHDAEALLVGADGLPLVITKVPSGKAEIFTPEAKLDPDGNTDPVPMKKVGEITLPKTTTDNPLNIIGRVAITGAARSPDGSRVVLRTYADAFEYDVSGDDIVAALTTGKPRVTPLADPFGEAISYTPDGTGFVTVSDGGELAPEDPIDILGYTPSTKGAEPVEGEAGAKPATEKSWYDNLSLDQITYLIGAVGVVGALLVGAGIVGIVRSRRRAATVGDDPVDQDDDVFTSGAVSRAEGRSAGDGPHAAEPVADRPRGGVYGAPATPGGSPARPAGGGVYGGGRPPAGSGAAPAGRPAGGPPPTGGRPAGGGVYGGGRPAGGGVYGAVPAGNGAGPRGGAPHGAPAGGASRGGPPAVGPRGGAPAGGRGGAPAGGRGVPPGGRGGAPVAGRGTPPGARGGTPPDGRGAAPGGGRGGAPAGGRGGPPPGGRGGAPAGGRGGGGGVYGGGGGRAEPPRRETDPREPRSGPRHEGHDDRRGGQYGPPPGRSGERY
ncbi:hypothetical protein [Micromonospora humidisoli]|uniref:WD40-like Beta Propeller Repeat n=1 Tax=Micromonospora humidisoli TaxID=2807622 RepID=A0ABS2J6G5_9ACTN|nr:hypothetical protein [Micromonospora humidisoli]MBM7081716.1 hypothetical protein [Micromonospora humidisoli]